MILKLSQYSVSKLYTDTLTSLKSSFSSAGSYSTSYY